MTTITESQWVDYFGFQRFPFDRPEAGNEEFARPDFLASCFVEPRGFERVFGQADSPVTSLLFAARGTGKTACRVMMDYYCQNGLARLSSAQFGEPNFVLSVPHTRLDNVREAARQASDKTESVQIAPEHHVIEIMRQAVPAFVNLIAKNSIFSKKISELSKPNFEDLSFYLVIYSAYLTNLQKDFLRGLGVSMPPIDHQIRGFTGQLDAHKKPIDWEPIMIQQRLDASPMVHLERWAAFMPMVGIKSMYVLVDGVDELMESADDPQYAHALIRPVLTNLKLMDGTHHLAFKFFLPTDMESVVLSDKKFRLDRGFVIQKIEWRPEDLINILRERLSALRRPDYEIRDRTAAGFDALCVPELRGQIELDIIEVVRGNPRRLMNFCSLMITTHCQRDIQNQDDPYQLNKDDFEQARATFEIPTGYLDDITTTQKLDIQRLIAEGEANTWNSNPACDGTIKNRLSTKMTLAL